MIYWGDGEITGWSIDEYAHNGSAYFTYTFDFGDEYIYDYISDIYGGVSKWSSYAAIWENEYSPNEFQTYYEASSVVAYWTYYGTDENGHVTSFAICLNRYNNPDSYVVAHEIGHQFGLNDLYDSNNSDKLMYGWQNENEPSTQDLKGFDVIIGLHNYHTEFSETAVEINDWYHGYPCTYCDGLDLEDHIFSDAVPYVYIHVYYCIKCNNHYFEEHWFPWWHPNYCVICEAPNLDTKVIPIYV